KTTSLCGRRRSPLGEGARIIGMGQAARKARSEPKSAGPTRGGALKSAGYLLPLRPDPAALAATTLMETRHGQTHHPDRRQLEDERTEGQFAGTGGGQGRPGGRRRLR